MCSSGTLSSLCIKLIYIFLIGIQAHLEKCSINMKQLLSSIWFIFTAEPHTPYPQPYTLYPNPSLPTPNTQSHSREEW